MYPNPARTLGARQYSLSDIRALPTRAEAAAANVGLEAQMARRSGEAFGGGPPAVPSPANELSVRTSGDPQGGRVPFQYLLMD